MAKNDDKRSTTDGVVVPTVGALDSNWANRRYDPEGLLGLSIRNEARDPRVQSTSDRFVN